MNRARRPAGRHLPAAAALAALSLSLTAGCSEAARCGPPALDEVSQMDLYGTYAGPHGSQLTLTNIGGTTVTFTARDWPAGNGVGILAQDAPSIDGEGTWSVVSAPGEAGRVRLSFEDREAGQPGPPLQQLEVGKSEADTPPMLFAKLGDPDVCRVYELERERQ
ncbi:hypothetical protein [Streptomyces sp. V2I9]|uniref:hypothetical protein n=1 Tax=Streptomyces sp. V2I9 TaxID=3042304 RepID=UPI00278923FC|nr:hypothetical protein [Streptomyces sp. V2I9]MDQ0986006.1 hypothetical protein [Streptomyces sp. V2I9]